jgi:hypothetical protein
MAICILSNSKFEVKRKDKLLLPKWDFLCKHVGRKKAKKNIRTNVKKGDWYYSKDYKHAKNHKLLVSYNHEFVATQVTNGEVGKKVQKVV